MAIYQYWNFSKTILSFDKVEVNNFFFDKFYFLIKIDIRSSDDPYILLQQLTKGTDDFSILSQKR